MNRTFTLLAGLALAGICGFGSAGKARATELIVNGGFESGNTGFSSGYSYQSNLGPAGTYYIGSDPTLYNNNWGTSFGPHSGSEMMIINGATVANVNVWSESGISVAPNTTYQFSAWIASNNNTFPAMLDFSINGGQVGMSFTASTNVGVWQEFVATWNSGSATTADVTIVDQNTAFGGNDFSIDDISLQGPTSAATVPAPPIGLPSFLVLGGIFFGAKLWGWQRRK